MLPIQSLVIVSYGLLAVAFAAVVKQSQFYPDAIAPMSIFKLSTPHRCTAYTEVAEAGPGYAGMAIRP